MITESVWFARLICEINATQELDLAALCKAMDLDEAGLGDIFESAHKVWEKAKSPPVCACCGTTENLHEDLGSGGPYRCSSIDCVVF